MIGLFTTVLIPGVEGLHVLHLWSRGQMLLTSSPHKHSERNDMTKTLPLCNHKCLISFYIVFSLKIASEVAGELAQWLWALNCSYRGCRFSSRCPRGNSQLLINLVAKDLTLALTPASVWWYRITHTHTHMHGFKNLQKPYLRY